MALRFFPDTRCSPNDSGLRGDGKANSTPFDERAYAGRRESGMHDAHLVPFQREKGLTGMVRGNPTPIAQNNMARDLTRKISKGVDE